MVLKKESKWSLIIIVDPEALPGDSIFTCIKHILQVINFKYVALNDIQGAPKAEYPGFISKLNEMEGSIMKMDDLLKMVCKVKQFDWGDFFLFREIPQQWEGMDNTYLYPKIVQNTDTTLRAVDDTYIYIYTPYDEVVKNLKSNYEIESVTYDLLEKLPYPY